LTTLLSTTGKEKRLVIIRVKAYKEYSKIIKEMEKGSGGIVLV